MHERKKSWFILFYWQRSEGKQCYKSYTAGFQSVTVSENVIFYFEVKRFLNKVNPPCKILF